MELLLLEPALALSLNDGDDDAAALLTVNFGAATDLTLVILPLLLSTFDLVFALELVSERSRLSGTMLLVCS